MTAIHRSVLRIARFMAVLGGLVLLTLILITCLSILGRALNTALHSDLATGLAPGLSRWLIDAGIGAIRGDFELVEAGMAFCIFAFLPLCQVSAGHASVDILWARFPPMLQRLLTFLAEALFALALVVIAVQLQSALGRLMRSGQTTFLLQFPLWWSYAASLGGAVIAAAAAVYMALMRFLELARGRPILPPPGAGT